MPRSRASQAANLPPNARSELRELLQNLTTVGSFAEHVELSTNTTPVISFVAPPPSRDGEEDDDTAREQTFRAANAHCFDCPWRREAANMKRSWRCVRTSENRLEGTPLQ